MKEVTSNCERDFIKRVILANKRLDGRELIESRQIKLTFGLDRGCCLVSLGNTCVLAQVSCELAPPRAVRPSEGQLHLNVDLSPMAAPNIEANRLSDTSVEQSRLLERCVRDSRCIDLESLCVVSGDKVWNIRVDVHVLNHDGNLAECASIAAVSSLAHFRRPDVTVLGTEVTVHPVEERDPVPLNLLHMPFSTTIVVFNQGENLIIDPSESEERIADGLVVVAMNTHQELCMLHMGGRARISKDKVMICTSMAAIRIQEICTIVKVALATDASARNAGLKIGFAEKLRADKVLGTNYMPKNRLFETLYNKSVKKEIDIDSEIPEVAPIIIQEPGIVLLGEGGPNQWDMLEMNTEIENMTTKVVKKVIKESISDAEDSEEDEVLVLS